jgi:hypothetical protein
MTLDTSRTELDYDLTVRLYDTALTLDVPRLRIPQLFRRNSGYIHGRHGLPLSRARQEALLPQPFLAILLS